MTTSRAHYSRMIDWSAVKGDSKKQMSNAVANFVYGIRGKRETPVTEAEILRFFVGTPADFVREGINRALENGSIGISRTSTRTRGARRQYVYSVTEEQV